MASNEKNMNLAPSNEVFELWLLLHLTDVSSDTSLPRKTVYKLLESHIKALPEYVDFEYKHGNESVLKPITESGDQAAAIQRAEALKNLTQSEKRSILEANPCTLVYLLIKDLIDWIKYYSYKPD